MDMHHMVADKDSRW